MGLSGLFSQTHTESRIYGVSKMGISFFSKVLFSGSMLDNQGSTLIRSSVSGSFVNFKGLVLGTDEWSTISYFGGYYTTYSVENLW